MKTASNIMAVPLNFEELLFTNKNKEYGSYILRKFYERNLSVACFAAVIIFSFIISAQLLVKRNNSKAHQTNGTICILTIGPPPSIEMDKPTQVIQLPPSAVKTIKFTVPEIVEDDKIIENIPTIEELLNVQPWTKTQDAEIGGYDPTLDFMEPKTNTEPEPMMKEVTWVPEMPHYPGGEEALHSFISSNIKYPELAKKAGIQGRVITSFTIERNGAISNIKIEKGIGGGCDEEAERVIALLEKWNPGKQNGNPVRVRIMIPINFKLQ